GWETREIDIPPNAREVTWEYSFLGGEVSPDELGQAYLDDVYFVPGTATRTEAPTDAPTDDPTTKPTDAPAKSPTAIPSEGPTASPSVAQTSSPTESPEGSDTNPPTAAPTKSEPPTGDPTLPPADAPTGSPSVAPTHQPSKDPTLSPSTREPTESPTLVRPVLDVTFDPIEIDFEDGPPSLDIFANNGWTVWTSQGGAFAGPLAPSMAQGDIADLSLTIETAEGAHFSMLLQSSMSEDDGDVLRVYTNDETLLSLDGPTPDEDYFPKVIMADPGRVTVKWRYEYGDDGQGKVSLDNIRITPGFSDDFESKDFERLPWVVEEGWFVDDIDPFDGNYSAHFPPHKELELSETRNLTLPLNTFADGLVTFALFPKVQMPCDQFGVYLDDVVVSNLFFTKPENNYSFYGINVPEGQHNLTFMYKKSQFAQPNAPCRPGEVGQ
ncbi:hypothetical protein ACHAWF_017269, partial [Thalassiosira exigua]